ncbi:REXO2 protein [Capsaspora owczarzaki ATCC 30864]|uniref:REXO2 protein n=1 Tax=Capsaspora owczarzaki (strain ATCC 30864) TaxID=595528 RepID=A0A0D2VHD7_CAPO3|nr:REXO2 protein [Capsaspora owczarzaki ATCC 30864]KJE89377.1 REXO2 protein [Capsaspora owczarzaki ATCC 30864]|eukprot:XP_004365731.1 REXO2 protein [Capsaspora owczarzaki ATCC 30864]
MEDLSTRMIWVDLEMTGLDVSTETIIEMACIVTDSRGNILAEGPDIIIHQPDEVLDRMNDWCKEHHGASGLTAAVRASTTSLAEAEEVMLAFVREHTSKGCVLAGNTIHMDKRFLDRYMPKFSAHLHYRLIDVSTLKELCRRWYPAIFANAPPKQGLHRALDDIKESIQELVYYQSNMFK